MKKIILFFLFSFIFTQNNSQIVNEGFTISIWGHVQQPGIIHVDFNKLDVDLIYILCKAGGPMPDAKLNKIEIISQDSGKRIINLKEKMKNGDYSDLLIKPNDTIIVKPKLIYSLKNNSSLIHTFLYMATLGLQISSAQQN